MEGINGRRDSSISKNPLAEPTKVDRYHRVWILTCTDGLHGYPSRNFEIYRNYLWWLVSESTFLSFFISGNLKIHISGSHFITSVPIQPLLKSYSLHLRMTKWELRLAVFPIWSRSVFGDHFGGLLMEWYGRILESPWRFHCTVELWYES